METLALRAANGRWIARRLIIARSFGDRLRGVLKHGVLQPDTALLITPCTSIHTFAVSLPIDAIFLSAQLRVLRLAPNIAPWRVRWAPSGTKHVVELAGGTLDVLHLQPGTFVCLDTSADEAIEVSPPSTRARCSAAHVQFSLRIPRRPRHDDLLVSLPRTSRAQPTIESHITRLEDERKSSLAANAAGAAREK